MNDQTVLFFETTDGHVCRMTCEDTIEPFRRNGLVVTIQFSSGQLFGTVDWLQSFSGICQ